jgi:hypothetical protein
MDKEVQDILLENLKESLKQFQNYLIWGMIASITYYILALNKSNTTNLNLPVVGSMDAVNTHFARLISLAVYWILGCMGSYALERIERISVKLFHKKELLKAVATYPSIATEIYPLVRVFAGLLPIVILVLGRIELWNNNAKTSDQIYKMVFLIIPYLTIIIQLLKNTLPLDKPEKIKIDK